MKDADTSPYDRAVPDAADLTLVVPCYREAARIGACLDAVAAWHAAAPLALQVVVVDDGSDDGTAEAARAHAGDLALTVAVHARNLGKGAALRTGFAASRGAQVAFFDADLSVDLGQLADLRAALEAGADLAAGCRTVPGAAIERRQPWRRRVLGRLYLRFARWWLGIGPRDVTCGFKALRGEVGRALMAATRTRRWGIDAELLHLAAREGLRVVEVPVRWRDSGSSRVRLWRDGAGSLAALVATRWRHRRRVARAAVDAAAADAGLGGR